MSLTGLDYSAFTRNIKVTKGPDGEYRYNDKVSLWNVLPELLGLDYWQKIAFSTRCILVAELQNELGVNPGELAASDDLPDGRVFGVLVSYFEERDDWLVEVVDPMAHENAPHIYVDWLSGLRASYIMKNEHDIAGLRLFLVAMGELLEEDELVDGANPKFRDRGPSAH